MTEKENEVEVVIEDEKDPSLDLPEVEIAKDEEPEKELTPEKGIDDLNAALEFNKKELEAKKLEHAAAEQRARDAESREQALQKTVQEANVQTLASSIETLKSNAATLKQQYRTAVESGDFDAQADLMELMTTNSAKMMQLENARESIQNRPAVQPRTKEAALDQMVKSLSPASGSWLRKNPSVIENEESWRKTQAAHQLALLDGVQVDTPEYFKFLEDKLNIGRREPVMEKKEEVATAPAAKRPAAAPVSHGNDTGTTRRPANGANRVTLTSAEVAMAKELGMTPAEYGKNKLLLMKEDRYKVNS